MNDEHLQETVDSAKTRRGVPVQAVPLKVAELAADSRQRVRRRVLYFVVPALVVGLAIAATHVKLGGVSKALRDKLPVVRGWEPGMQLIGQGEVSRGLAVLEDAVDAMPEGPGRVTAHVRLADVYGKLGEDHPHYLNSAIRHLRLALAWPGGAVPVDRLLYDTGSCFLQLGSHETALEYFEQLDSTFPNSLYKPQARFYIGECALATGQYQRAREVLAEVADAYQGEALGEKAFFRFAYSFDAQAQSLKGK